MLIWIDVETDGFGIRLDGMKLPVVSHLQFAILDFLRRTRKQYAVELRQLMKEELRLDYTGPKLYQLMDRLAADGYISILREVIVTDAGKQQATSYAITAKGRYVHDRTVAFYQLRS